MMINKIITFYPCVFSAILMYYGIKLANVKFKKYFGVCLSNEKTSLYHEPMIRGLGVLYIIALFPTLILTDHNFSSNEILLIVLSTLLGFADDKYGISQIKKILLLAFLIVGMELVSTSLSYSSFLEIVFKIVLFLFLTLFFNQIDGINGLAGSTFLLTFCSFLFLINFSISFEVFISIVILIIIYLNTNLKGKVGIQGEAGSFFMGAVIFVFIQKYNNSINFIYIIMSVLPILSDVITTTIIRVWFVKNIFLSHRNHLYQRLVAKNRSHLAVTATFGVLQILTIIFTLYLFNFDYSQFKLITISIVILIFLMFNFRYSFLIHKERF